MTVMTAKIFYDEIRCHRPIVAEHAGNYYHEKTNFCSRYNVEILIQDILFHFHHRNKHKIKQTE